MSFQKSEVLFGEDDFKKLKDKKVLVVGVGGVGGYVCEMLARSGIGEIGLIDFDIVEKTNINRQIIALNSTIGQKKVDVMKQRLKDINPEIIVNACAEKITKNNLTEFDITNYNYVVDAIDSRHDKVELICYCHENNVNIVSAMGTGNKTLIPSYEVVDIFSTCYDPFAKAVRKKLKRLKTVSKLDVVYSSQPIIKKQESHAGSVVYHPAMCACVISAFVIDKLIKEN